MLPVLTELAGPIDTSSRLDFSDKAQIPPFARFKSLARERSGSANSVLFSASHCQVVVLCPPFKTGKHLFTFTFLGRGREGIYAPM